MEENSNFKSLNGPDEYACYFDQLQFVFEKLRDVFSVRASQRDARYHESVVVSEFLSKMLYTIIALRKKYTYNPRRGLRVDLSDSGFPSYFDMNYLITDLQRKEVKLAQLPTLQALKQETLDFMFKHKAEPSELLWRLSERAYYEMLDPDKLFLPFTPSSSLKVNKMRNKRFRSYTFSWACYDFATNRPYVHIMMFEQDVGSVPLENGDMNYQEFVDTVREEGSRTPGIGVLALGIDTNLRDIHPKVIKRICVGPVCTKQFSKDPEELFALLTQNGENEDDFILLFEDEVILSSSQKVSRSVFSFGQARETFYIPETDIECYDRKASKIHKHILLPHTVLQHTDIKGAFREYRDYEIITYDKKGGIHVR